MNREQWVEVLICSALPGEGQTGSGVESLGVAAAGMPQLQWCALCWRYLGDRASLEPLYAALYAVAACNRYRFVRERAALLARLALAEEAHPHIVGKLEPTAITDGFLLCEHEPHRPALMRAYRELRARADSWARSGLAHLGRG